MAEILGLGVTHQPPLSGGKSIRPMSLSVTLREPGLPEHLRDPANWPDSMRREWGDDEGASHARSHQETIAGELRRVRAALDEFRPDFVVVFGDDHYENFREDIVPPFSILAYDRLEFKPWAKGGDNYWNEPADKTFVVEGHRRAGKYLASRLLEQSFDIAYAYQPLHVPVGHAFRNTVLYLDWDRRGFSYPIVPIAVNCYGRIVVHAKGYIRKLGEIVGEEELDPPSPMPSRCFALGAAIARSLAASPWRVAIIASSSWSHAFLTEKNHHLWPDHDADRVMYRALREADWTPWRTRSLQELEDAGQHEMLNWHCLAGAMAELDRKPIHTSYVESSVMNSNKVFAIFSSTA